MGSPARRLLLEWGPLSYLFGNTPAENLFVGRPPAGDSKVRGLPAITDNSSMNTCIIIECIKFVYFIAYLGSYDLELMKACNNCDLSATKTCRMLACCLPF